MMSIYSHIIVERQPEGWFAWFEGKPDFPSSGADEMDAIHRLMEIHQLPNLSVVQIVSVDDGSPDGQVQIRIPDRLEYLVMPSDN